MRVGVESGSDECTRHRYRKPVSGRVCSPVCHHRGSRFVVVTYCADGPEDHNWWFLDFVEDLPGDDVEVECLAVGKLGVDSWDEAWESAVALLRSDVHPVSELRRLPYDGLADS